MLTSPNTHRLWACLFLAACALVVTPARAQMITTGNLLTNPGAEQGTGTDPGIVTGWTAAGPSNPGRDNGSLDGIPPFAGSYDFYGNSGANGTLTQRVDLLSAGISAPLLAAPGNMATFSFYERSLNDIGTVGPNGTGDTAGVNLFFLNAAGTQIGTATSGQIYSPGQWTFLTATAALPVGTRYIDYQMSFVRNVGVDADGYIDDTSLTVRVVPEPSTWAAALSGLGLLVLARRRSRA